VDFSSAFISATGGYERDIPIVPDRVGAGSPPVAGSIPPEAKKTDERN